MKSVFLFIARALFSLIFIVAGVSKIFNWSDTVQGMVMTFSQWQIHLESWRFAARFLPFYLGLQSLLK